MVNKIISFRKKALFLLVFIAIFSFCAQLVFSDTLKAQPGEDPNYKYPVLKEKDFQLLVKTIPMMEASDQNELPNYLKENNIDLEYFEAITIKVSMNYVAELMNNKSELGKQLGKSILFNSSERKLFEKYKKEIVVGLDIPGAPDEYEDEE